MGETNPLDGSVNRPTADIDEEPLATTEFNGGGVLVDESWWCTPLLILIPLLRGILLPP